MIHTSTVLELTDVDAGTQKTTDRRIEIGRRDSRMSRTRPDIGS